MEGVYLILGMCEEKVRYVKGITNVNENCVFLKDLKGY